MTRLCAVFAFAALVAAATAAATETPVTTTASVPHACLSKEAQKQAVADNRAMPLAQAVKLAHSRQRGELVRARLCQSPGNIGPNGGLVYLLTLLARNGKVSRVTVDAANGSLIGAR